jgi:hypothetical protein
VPRKPRTSSAARRGPVDLCRIERRHGFGCGKGYGYALLVANLLRRTSRRLHLSLTWASRGLHVGVSFASRGFLPAGASNLLAFALKRLVSEKASRASTVGFALASPSRIFGERDARNRAGFRPAAFYLHASRFKTGAAPLGGKDSTGRRMGTNPAILSLTRLRTAIRCRRTTGRKQGFMDDYQAEYVPPHTDYTGWRGWRTARLDAGSVRATSRIALRGLQIRSWTSLPHIALGYFGAIPSIGHILLGYSCHTLDRGRGG